MANTKRIDQLNDGTPLLTDYAPTTPSGGPSTRATWTAILNLGGFGLLSGSLSQFASTTSAQLAGVISDETGTGALVFANSPTLVTPALGTPASGNLANCTGIPTSVSNADGTLTISPTTGAVVASLALGHANTWIGVQTFTSATTGAKGVLVQNIASQTANAQEWQNSSGTAYVSVGPATLAGDSTTKNYLNITGTFPTIITSATYAASLVITTAGTSGFETRGLSVSMLQGYTGSTGTSAGVFDNAVAGTGATGTTFGNGNYGAWARSTATTTGHNVGITGEAHGGNVNIGSGGFAVNAKNSATNIAGYFIALNTGTTPTQVGGYFGLQNTAPTFASAALMCDNGSQTSDIFVARDNGTAAFTIADQGVITSSPVARTSGSAPYFTINAPADTTLTASTEAIGISHVGATRQFATGNITTQREVVFAAPTYSFVGSSSFTNLATVAITGAPVLGTNAGIGNASNQYALWVQGGITSLGGIKFGLANTGTPNPTASGNNAGVDLNANNLAITNSSWLMLSNAGVLSWSEDNSSATFKPSTQLKKSAGGVVSIISGASTPGALVIGQPGTGTYGLTVTGFAARTVSLVQLRTDAGSSLGNVGGCVFDHFTDGASTHTDGTEDTLYTDTTVANTLAINGDKITARYTVSLVGSATATRRIRLYFAGIVIFDSGSLTIGATAGTVVYDVQVIRATSTTCRAIVEMRSYGSATLLGLDAATYTAEATLTGLTLSGTNILKVTGVAAGTGAASGDITATMGTISVIPEGN